jgi:hypothetical protein
LLRRACLTVPHSVRLRWLAWEISRQKLIDYTFDQRHWLPDS